MVRSSLQRASCLNEGVWIYPAESLKNCKQGNYISTKKISLPYMPLLKSKQALYDLFISTFFVSHLFLSQKVTAAEIFCLVKNGFQWQLMLSFEDASVNID